MPSDAPIAIAYSGPVATGQYAAAQTNCHIVSIAGDLTTSVLSSTLSDKFGNFTFPGLAAFVNSVQTCHYMRDVGRQVNTPIDANLIDITYANVPNDRNLNSQRFLIRALQRADGTPAGARYRLASTDADEGANEQATDPFLLAYRDARDYYERPFKFAIAKPLPNGSLLCVELSLRDSLLYFGGHSKHSMFTAERCPRYGLSAGQYNSKGAETTISVWGDDSGYVTLFDESELEADSVNPIGVIATRPEVQDGEEHPAFVMTRGYTTRGNVSHRLDLNVTFKFPESTCLELSEKEFKVCDPAYLAALFGCHETADVACVPGRTDFMISANERLERPRSSTVRRTRRADTAVISMDNVVSGRRAAVKQCDLTLRRIAAEDSLMHDGQYLPGHPMYEKLKEELDEINDGLVAEGKPPLIDPRIAQPPSPKRQRRSVVIFLE
jgi:hypothetical protein